MRALVTSPCARYITAQGTMHEADEAIINIRCVLTPRMLNGGMELL